MKKLFTVSASHVSPTYALDVATVEVRSNDDGATWYADHRPHGCGKSCSAPERAIVSLLSGNGCTGITIYGEASNAQTVERLKADGRHGDAGRLAYESNLPRDYGCHYDMRSNRDLSMREFYAGYDAAKAESSPSTESTPIKFRRFANLDEMTAHAVDVARNHDRLTYAESGIYSDDNGLTFRPQVSLYSEGEAMEVLRWNAFSEQDDVSHMGKRARVEAREAGDWFANHIQEAINASKARGDKPTPSTEESRPHIYDELTEAEKREALERGFPRGADVRYILKRRYGEFETKLIRWTRVSEVPAAPSPSTIDITPTWESILPALIAAIENGTNEGKRLARIELARMAKVADMAATAREELDSQELATVLAALRFYQESGMGDPENRSDAIHDIATNGDSVISLDADAIDSLCERLNMGPTNGN